MFIVGIVIIFGIVVIMEESKDANGSRGFFRGLPYIFSLHMNLVSAAHAVGSTRLGIILKHIVERIGITIVPRGLANMRSTQLERSVAASVWKDVGRYSSTRASKDGVWRM